MERLTHENTDQMKSNFPELTPPSPGVVKSANEGREDGNNVDASSPELEPATAGEVRAWSREWIRHRFERGTSDDMKHFDPFDVISSDIAGLVGDKAAFQEEWKITQRYSEGMVIFFNELICFVHEQSISQDNKPKLRQFLSNIQELLFSYSPNISNHLPLDEQMLMTAKANREPEIQGWFGQTMVGEMVYSLSYSTDESFVDMERRIKGMTRRRYA
jgi:hypothetical protein